MKKAIIRGYYCDTLPLDYDEKENSIWYGGKWVNIENIEGDVIIYNTKLPPKRI